MTVPIRRRPWTRTWTALPTLMKQRGLTFGLSGAPQEVVTELGKLFQFTQSFGSTCSIQNNCYTGQLSRNLVVHETKAAVFQAILTEFNINPSVSFGFGDTEQDASFLQAIGHPIALNPNQALASMATQQEWVILNDYDKHMFIGSQTTDDTPFLFAVQTCRLPVIRQDVLVLGL